MHRAYLAFGWGMIAFGLLHVSATGRYFAGLTQSALWFASAGLLAVLAGAVNLVNRSCGRAAPGVRRLTVATNLGLTVFAILTGAVGHATVAEFVVVGVLFGGACVLSGVRAAYAGHGAA